MFGVSLAGGTLWSVYPGPLGALLLTTGLLVIIVSLIVALCRTGFSLFRKQWQLFGARLIMLVVAFPVIFMGLRLGAYVHLAILYPYYHGIIVQTSKRPLRFPWDDQALSAIQPAQIQTLLYDDTGETTATNTPEPGADGIYTSRRHLISNFFIEDVTYD